MEKEETGKGLKEATATASKKAKKATPKKQGDGSGVSNKIEVGGAVVFVWLHRLRPQLIAWSYIIALPCTTRTSGWMGMASSEASPSTLSFSVGFIHTPHCNRTPCALWLYGRCARLPPHSLFLPAATFFGFGFLVFVADERGLVLASCVRVLEQYWCNLRIYVQMYQECTRYYADWASFFRR